MSSLDSDAPLAKRQRVSTAVGTSDERAQTSRIFAPFRTVGLVSPTGVPFTTVPMGKTTFQITTSVGRALQTYDLRRGLNLVFVTRPQTPADITATTAWRQQVLAAWGGCGKGESQGLWIFERGVKVSELELPLDMAEPIRQIAVFGTWIVASGSTRIEVFKTATLEHYTTIHTMAAANGGNEITGGITTMPTFLNKIFVGRRDGWVEIWNVSTGKLIYTILPPSPSCGSVTCLEPSPALSLMAIAYSGGSLTITNVLTDKRVLRIEAASPEAPVSCISFRTDGMGAGNDGRKDGVMATSTAATGDITFWDLHGGGRVIGVLRGAHNPPSADGLIVPGGVSKIEFLAGQAVIITSGRDNSLKSWIFDKIPFSPIPRPLHTRSGHAGPVNCLHFLPSDFDGAEAGNKWLLSGGRDRSLWGWSLRRDGQSAELSQGNVRKKAKKIGILAASALAHETSGKTGWESVVTAHKGDPYARTWLWGRKRAGRWALPTGDGADVSTVAISPCGTFAVVGSDSGSIVMYNLQSGICRQRFPSRLTPSQARQLRLQQLRQADDVAQLHAETGKRFPPGTGKHTKAVTGIVVDSLNQYIVSCSLDGKIKFWDFLTGTLLQEIDWSPMTTPVACRYHAANNLLAFACDDMSVRVVDLETKKTIREFWGPLDNRVIRVWDLPTSHMIDAIRLEKPCTALAMNCTGEYLAATIQDEPGVTLWTNKAMFKHVPTRQISEKDIGQASAPTVSGEGNRGILEGAFEDEEQQEESLVVAPPIDQLSSGMMTLSLVPKSRWQTLLHLDLIKERNKPKEPPKAPEKAPFFLPSRVNSTSNGQQDVAESAENEAKSRISKLDQARFEELFSSKLRSAAAANNYDDFIEHLKSLSPSSADLEIRSLSVGFKEDDGNELLYFIKALTARLEARKDYELTQAWMTVFLRLHFDVVMGSDVLLAALAQWKVEQERECSRLDDLVGYCGGVVGFLRSPRT
ncbi:utp21 specific WD40 associated putative domain-containing protein [Hirsutella rhossiliensis]|uniref:Utp21 specific WD40 associated putative domain-containing protein n=1 Tax=Hirsutella rhossiliensis TaxID=111463 RepID=A0A9P8N0C2_9HYPO|nr:utp21 specific WD40 associated putative domain-containing protein [Hirsutella rhossiliensis]KAH0965813.1 utp21 specific WD40 associated putative domain-containing protein [Hirsutella rhossiliensis]